MHLVPLTAVQKIGIVLYGLAAGAGSVLLVAVVSFLSGGAISMLSGYFGWPHLGEWSAWLAIVAGYYGFYLGIIVGAIICGKIWWTRLRGAPIE